MRLIVGTAKAACGISGSDSDTVKNARMDLTKIRCVGCMDGASPVGREPRSRGGGRENLVAGWNFTSATVASIERENYTVKPVEPSGWLCSACTTLSRSCLRLGCEKKF